MATGLELVQRERARLQEEQDVLAAGQVHVDLMFAPLVGDTRKKDAAVEAAVLFLFLSETGDLNFARTTAGVMARSIMNLTALQSVKQGEIDALDAEITLLGG